MNLMKQWNLRQVILIETFMMKRWTQNTKLSNIPVGGFPDSIDIFASFYLKRTAIWIRLKKVGCNETSTLFFKITADIYK